MKRTMIIVGSLAALGAAYLGNRLWAQATVPGGNNVAAPTVTRVGFLNIETVLQNYEKAKTYKAEMDRMIEPYRLKAETLKKEIIKWTEDLRDPKFDPSKREQWEQGIINNKRQLEDLQKQVGKLYQQTSEKQIVQIYKEVDEAVKAHAVAHGFHAVFSYGDNPQANPMSIENIVRKIRGMEGSGCTAAMYIAPGLDISVAVAESLNHRYRAAGNTTTPTGITPTSGTRP